MHRRRFIAAIALVLALGTFILLTVERPPSGHATTVVAAPAAATAPESSSDPTAPPATKPHATTTTSTTLPFRGIKLNPAWPKTLTLMTDSVTLGDVDALKAALPGWSVDVLGKPALMVKQLVPQ